MTKDKKSKSTKWDRNEKEWEKLMDAIDKWDGKDEVAKARFLVRIIGQYARINDVEFHHKNTDTPESNDFQRYCRSIVMPRDKDKVTESMRDFMLYVICNYGLAIEYHDDKDIIPDARKLSDKELDLLMETDDSYYTDEEMTQRFLQARYPTVADKTEVIEKEMDRLMDRIEQNDDNEDDEKVNLELVAKLRKYVEGYDDAPDIYRLMRVLTYVTAENKGWDEAEIEKVLQEEVKDRVRSGKISAKEFTKIKKVVQRETDKKIQLWESGK